MTKIPGFTAVMGDKIAAFLDKIKEGIKKGDKEIERYYETFKTVLSKGFSPGIGVIAAYGESKPLILKRFLEDLSWHASQQNEHWIISFIEKNKEIKDVDAFLSVIIKYETFYVEKIKPKYVTDSFLTQLLWDTLQYEKKLMESENNDS